MKIFSCRLIGGFLSLFMTQSAGAGGWGFEADLWHVEARENAVILSVSVQQPDEYLGFLGPDSDADICRLVHFAVESAVGWDCVWKGCAAEFSDMLSQHRARLQRLAAARAEIYVAFIAEAGELTRVSQCRFSSMLHRLTFDNLATDRPTVILGLSH